MARSSAWIFVNPLKHPFFKLFHHPFASFEHPTYLVIVFTQPVFFRAASGVQPNSFTYCALFSACEKAAAWSVALDSLQLLPCIRLMPETLLGNAVLSACGKAGNWMRTTSWLGGDASNTNDVSFNAALAGLGSDECGLWRRGQALFHVMRSEGIQCNLISCNSLMTIFEKSREWRHGQNLLATGLHCFGVTEDSVTFNAVLSAYEKGRQWRCAQWQLACVLKSKPTMVSVVTLGACISAYGVAAAWERATHLYSRLVELGIQANSVTCGAALSACERGRSWALALRLAESCGFPLGDRKSVV